MDDTVLVIVAIVATLVVVALGWILWNRRHSRDLKESFGSEYDRAVTQTGDRSKGEKLLDQRRKRVEEYDLHPLSAEERVGFRRRWDEVQQRFVDDPSASISDAQHLVDEVMQERGYPIGDARRQQEDVSVESPGVVVHYRTAREISQRNDAGKASTEDLRLAMKHYRSLFNNLLEGGEAAREETIEESEAHVG